MSPFAITILDRAEATFGDALPRLAGALLLVVVGIPIVLLLARFVRRMLSAAGLDELGERSGVHDGLSRIRLERSLSGLIARGVRIALIVVVVVAAISLLGFGALSLALNQVVLFVPKLFVAVAIVIAGMVLAEFLRRRVEAMTDEMAIGVPVGQMTEVVVIALFTLTALALIGIPVAVLLALVSLVIAAGVFSFALAFGLGGRDVAREVSAGRSLAGSFSVGDRITVAEVTGEITALEAVSVVVRTDEGATVRVPNRLLVEEIVQIHQSEPA